VQLLFEQTASRTQILKVPFSITFKIRPLILQNEYIFLISVFVAQP